MATVYRATDHKHQRDVANKVLHPDRGAALGGDRAIYSGVPRFNFLSAMATRTTKTFDIAAVARGMKTTGLLSVREVARGAFGAGGMVLIDYGRPHVRERSIWGGTLVPFDSVWRAGANDATHLFTARTLALGTLTLTLAPSMYTLWVQHTRSGTFLIANKQTGQWGTVYDPAQDIGRVQLQMAAAPSHVEEFTIVVKALAANRGAIEMSWGRVCSAYRLRRRWRGNCGRMANCHASWQL